MPMAMFRMFVDFFLNMGNGYHLIQRRVCILFGEGGSQVALMYNKTPAALSTENRVRQAFFVLRRDF